ncbi:MAG: LysR substrate-binding domain-containing protein [Methylocella sp.]
MTLHTLSATINCRGSSAPVVSRRHAVDDLARGTLVRVLSEFPPPAVPVSLLYPPNRQLSPRVRIFIDWAAGEFEKRNAPA